MIVVSLSPSRGIRLDRPRHLSVLSDIAGLWTFSFCICGLGLYSCLSKASYSQSRTNGRIFSLFPKYAGRISSQSGMTPEFVPRWLYTCAPECAVHRSKILPTQSTQSVHLALAHRCRESRTMSRWGYEPESPCNASTYVTIALWLTPDRIRTSVRPHVVIDRIPKTGSRDPPNFCNLYPRFSPGAGDWAEL